MPADKQIVKEWNKMKVVKNVTSQNFADMMIYNIKGKLVPLPHEQREKVWINCRKYIIDLTSCSMCRHFCADTSVARASDISCL